MTPDLFTYAPPARYPFEAGFKAEGTSREAAAHVESTGAAAINRRLSLEAIEDSVFGLTTEEVAEKLGKKLQSIAPRITELKGSGLIVDTGIRRRTSSGCNAAVWRAA
jgi:hypothetical protein